MSIVIGWDIGGVHLKAARAESGRIVKAIQLAAPLRSGVERLAEAFTLAKAELGTAQRHVVTMTGELADTFSSRVEGVECLALLAARKLDGAPVSIYAGPAGYIRPEEASAHAGLVASANWHACASFVAARRRDAIFIDMGSTTTDVVAITDGAVAARGYTDVQRLAAGELVYTGLVRSFIMACADRAPFKGSWTPPAWSAPTRPMPTIGLGRRWRSGLPKCRCAASSKPSCWLIRSTCCRPTRRS